MLDTLLQKYNLRYEDLNAAERETMNQWMQAIAAKIVTPGLVRDYVAQMKDAVEAEIAAYDTPKSLWDFFFRKRQDVYRRARIRNYILLLAFLDGPQKAQKALENSLKGLKPTN